MNEELRIKSEEWSSRLRRPIKDAKSVSTILHSSFFTLHFIIALFCAVPVWAKAQGSFEQGVKDYEQGRFKNAVQEFEKWIDIEGPSAAAYYNLGNAYSKLGQRGKAVWAFERALKLDPRDEDARSNVETVRKGLLDKETSPYEAPGRAFWAVWIDDKLRGFRTDELAWIFSGLTLLFALGFVCFSFFPDARPTIKKAIVLFFVLEILAGSAVAARWLMSRHPSSVVTESEVYGRYGHSEDATRAFLLHEGAKVKVLKSNGDWIFVQFGDSKNAPRGWIPRAAALQI